MEIRCVWEHNYDDTLLYSIDFAGAFTRGKTRDEAMRKMPCEIRSYLKWTGDPVPDFLEPIIVQEKNSGLTISDADSDVLFDEEKKPLNILEYDELKALALKSARDFLMLYETIPDKSKSCLPVRTTFYGQVPRTAFEMYEHTKNVNNYYFSQIGVSADNRDDIAACRKRGFLLLESQPDFLKNAIYRGDYDEEWSLRKGMRRFIWHDRIHAKAMYRMAVKTFGSGSVPDVFSFGR